MGQFSNPVATQPRTNEVLPPPRAKRVNTVTVTESNGRGKHPTSIKALLCWSRFVRKLETWLPSVELQFVALMTKFDRSESNCHGNKDNQKGSDKDYRWILCK